MWPWTSAPGESRTGEPAKRAPRPHEHHREMSALLAEPDATHWPAGAGMRCRRGLPAGAAPRGCAWSVEIRAAKSGWVKRGDESGWGSAEIPAQPGGDGTSRKRGEL